MTANNDENQFLLDTNEERLALVICRHHNGDSRLNQTLHKADSASEFNTESRAGLKIMRRQASNDARHIAICCVYGVDYLLTLNMKDMANEHRIRKLNKLAKKYGYRPPKILTPEQFIVLYNRGEL